MRLALGIEASNESESEDPDPRPGSSRLSNKQMKKQR